jgi:hypothetical protein
MKNLFPPAILASPLLLDGGCMPLIAGAQKDCDVVRQGPPQADAASPGAPARGALSWGFPCRSA